MVLLTAFLITTSAYNLPPGLLASLCYVESNHKLNKIHYLDGKTDSYGICQVKLETARLVGFKGTPEQLMNPAVNIHYAGKYLQHQLNRYQDVQKAVIAYNKGSAGLFTSSKYQAKVYKEWSNNEFNTYRYQYCGLSGRL
jgi:soluble lytic murein transglycosylase-like protein